MILRTCAVSGSAVKTYLIRTQKVNPLRSKVSSIIANLTTASLSSRSIGLETSTPPGNLEQTFPRKLSLATWLDAASLTQGQLAPVPRLPPGRRNLNWGRRTGWRVYNLSLELGAVGHTLRIFLRSSSSSSLSSLRFL